MGLTDSLGLASSGININFDSILHGAGQFLLLLFLFLIAGVIFYFAYYLKKKKKKYDKKIFWFEEIHGEMVPIGDDSACELTIPGSTLTVFYIKKKNMYLPRPVIRMGKNAYWFAIRNNRELVNFSMKNINKEMKEANLNYDHTDMRYALTNLKELIKRNYRDNSQPWWREYKDVIGLVILIFVLTASFVFLFSKVGTLINQVGALIEHADTLIKTLETKAGSGLVVK